MTVRIRYLQNGINGFVLFVLEFDTYKMESMDLSYIPKIQLERCIDCIRPSTHEDFLFDIVNCFY